MIGQTQGGGGGGGYTTPIAPSTYFVYNYDPPIYDITSGCRVPALFRRDDFSKSEAAKTAKL